MAPLVALSTFPISDSDIGEIFWFVASLQDFRQLKTIIFGILDRDDPGRSDALVLSVPSLSAMVTSVNSSNLLPFSSSSGRLSQF